MGSALVALDRATDLVEASTRIETKRPAPVRCGIGRLASRSRKPSTRTAPHDNPRLLPCVTGQRSLGFVILVEGFHQKYVPSDARSQRPLRRSLGLCFWWKRFHLRRLGDFVSGASGGRRPAELGGTRRNRPEAAGTSRNPLGLPWSSAGHPRLAAWPANLCPMSGSNRQLILSTHVPPELGVCPAPCAGQPSNGLTGGSVDGPVRGQRTLALALGALALHPGAPLRVVAEEAGHRP